MNTTIPERFKIVVYYNARGVSTQIHLYDGHTRESRVRRVYDESTIHEIGQCIGRKDSEEEIFERFLNQNMRVLAIGAEDATVNWSPASSSPVYHYKKIRDNIGSIISAKGFEGIIAGRHLEYILVREGNYDI